MFSAIVYVSVNERLYGGIVPHVVLAGPATGADGVLEHVERVTRLVTLWGDPASGLLAWAPVLGLAFLALWLLWRSRHERLALAVPGQRDAEVAATLCALVVRRAAPRRRVPRPGRARSLVPGAASRGCAAVRVRAVRLGPAPGAAGRARPRRADRGDRRRGCVVAVATGSTGLAPPELPRGSGSSPSRRPWGPSRPSRRRAAADAGRSRILMGWRRVSRAPASSGAPESWPSSRPRSREAADGRPVAGVRGRRVGRRQDPAAGRARAPRARRGRARARRRLRRARRGRAPLRAARRRAAPAGPQRRPGLGELPARRSAPSSRRCCPSSRGARRRAGAGADEADAAQRAAVRGAARAARAARAASGRCCSSLEDIHWADRSTRAFLAFLAAQPVRRAGARRRHLPLRRAAPPPSAAPAARRARARRPRAARSSSRRFDRDGAGRAARRTSSARRRTPTSSTACTRAARATRCSPRSCSPPGSTAAAALPPTLRDALMLRIERLARRGPGACCGCWPPAGGWTTSCSRTPAAWTARELRDALREAVESHIVVVDDEGRYTFRHALLREVVVRRPAPRRARRAAPRARARARAPLRRGAARRVGRGAHRRALPRRGRPARRARAPRAGGRARPSDVRAHGEAAALLERALELWDRVPDAEEHAGVRPRRPPAARAARAHYRASDDARAVTLMERRWRGSTRRAEPRRASEVLGACRACVDARPRRGRRDTLARALELLPEDEPSRERAELLVDQVRFAMLQGRYRETRRDGAREALAASEPPARRPRRPRPQPPRRRARCALGERRARAPSAARRARRSRASAGCRRRWPPRYVNLADALHLAGRSREALEVTQEGLAELAGPGRGRRLARALAWRDRVRSRRLGGGRSAAPAPGAPPPASTLVNVALRRAELALGRGEHGARAAAARRDRRARRDTLEPQFIGAAAARCAAELERREGDLDGGARGRRRRRSTGSSSAPRTSRASRGRRDGAAIEADAAERARDLGDDAAARRRAGAAPSGSCARRGAAGDGRPGGGRAPRARREAERDARARRAPTPRLGRRGRGVGRRSSALPARPWRAGARPRPARGGDREAAAAAAGARWRRRAASARRWLATRPRARARARLRARRPATSRSAAATPARRTRSA